MKKSLQRLVIGTRYLSLTPGCRQVHFEKRAWKDRAQCVFCRMGLQAVFSGGQDINSMGPSWHGAARVASPARYLPRALWVDAVWRRGNDDHWPTPILPRHEDTSIRNKIVLSFIWVIVGDFNRSKKVVGLIGYTVPIFSEWLFPYRVFDDFNSTNF